MAKEFRKGKDLIKQSAEQKGGKRRFTPNIYWKPGDVRVIAWVTAADDIPKVRLHQMIRIPDDRFDSGFRYETFLCKKDPSMIDDFGGFCELCDKVEHDAVERFAALAIELEPLKEGKRVKEVKIKYDHVKREDGTEVDYPRWGLVVQAANNFFNYYAAYDESQGDIREVAWEIHREGGSSNTKYHPYIVMNGPNAVPLPDLSKVIEDMPTLEDLLEQMASEEKYAQVAELQPGSQPTFGGKKTMTDSGTEPSGDGETDFEKIKSEVIGSY